MQTIFSETTTNLGFRTIILAGCFVAAASACLSAPDDEVFTGNQSALTPCSADVDCKGDRICSEGLCVDPSGGDGGDGGSSPSPPPGGTGAGDPGACFDAGSSCDPEACCAGNLCVDYGGSIGAACGAVCSAGSDCESGCCSELVTGEHACAPAEFCGSPEECWDSYDCAFDSWCILDANDDQTCFLSCSTTADCDALPGSICRAADNVEGDLVLICSY